MKIARLRSDQHGESFFDEIEYPLIDQGDIGFLSETQPATGIIFRETAPDYDYNWHNAPRRQYVVILDGDVEITASNGEARSFYAGDIILLEDVDGKGHCSRAITKKTRKSLFITLD